MLNHQGMDSIRCPCSKCTTSGTKLNHVLLAKNIFQHETKTPKKRGFNNVFAGFYVTVIPYIFRQISKILHLSQGFMLGSRCFLFSGRNSWSWEATSTESPPGPSPQVTTCNVDGSSTQNSPEKMVGKQKCGRNWGKPNSKWVFLFNMPPSISRFLLFWPRDLTIWSQSLVEVEVKQSFLCIACSFRKMSDLVPYIAIYQLDLQLKKGALWVLIIS